MQGCTERMWKSVYFDTDYTFPILFNCSNYGNKILITLHKSTSYDPVLIQLIQVDIFAVDFCNIAFSPRLDIPVGLFN
jgi:hypothetical protein